MGRSNETFNKKEKEKNRQKRHNEKKEKSALRKANSGKGKGLEEMLAYVDENGNITSAPPAGTRKTSNANEIPISTPRQVDEPEDKPRSGVISFYNTGKGFGFIRDERSSENIFFHVNNLSYQGKENDKVNFVMEKGPKGFVALNITKG